MKEVKIYPAEQRVVVLPDEIIEEKTRSGIIIPKTAQEDTPGMGLVVATGVGSLEHPMNYFIGERVLFSQYAGLEVKLNLDTNGEHIYKVMNQADIMAKIHEL